MYNYIRSKDFEFFKAHKKTGNDKLDDLIKICTHCDPN